MINANELEFLKKHVENPNLINSYNDSVKKAVEVKLSHIIKNLEDSNETIKIKLNSMYGLKGGE